MKQQASHPSTASGQSFLLSVILALQLGFIVFPSLGQVNLQNIYFQGKVSCEGKGVADVRVTDGINITYTDAKGNYSLRSNATVEFVYISVPSGYKIPLKDGIPYFYTAVNEKIREKQKIDFTLEKNEMDDHRHAMFVWADPQVYYEEEMPLLQKTATDARELAGELFPDIPSYGMVCGDIVGDHPEFYGRIRKMLAETGIPFFYTAGNHDMTLDVRSNDHSKATYRETFGPDYYSFDRGKIHYVVLSDVFYVGRSYFYIGYLPEQQLNWLQQDLSTVKPGSTVVVMLHIPTWSLDVQEGKTENMLHVLQNRRHLHEMLQPFQAHIFSGHMHYNENFMISDNLYEHIHAAVCGVFWQGPECSDGTPGGYAVYQADGDHISWFYKSVGKSKDFQFRAYPVGASTEKPDVITANVWNYDPQWKVYWYEDGTKKGEMTRFTGHDPYTSDYIRKNKEHFRHKWISTRPTRHMFYAYPEKTGAKIKVEVVDRFGNVYSQDIDR
ncbi:MAG: calcineurin-like phosphoesterase family protein [Bacteroidales bacterium]|jgi:hypothetical protein|nr:calcineurin-like phosphoesterase family protein [Bacteroidales bacterium]